jgi:putative transposase
MQVQVTAADVRDEVERTFAWFSAYRRLARDYEVHLHSSETMIYAALTHLMLRRLAK